MSYAAISKKLQIPKTTLSEWFSKEGWSQEIRQKLTEAATAESTVRIQALDKVRGEHLKKIYEEAREEAETEFATLKYHPLFIAGMMLFWGEGTKAAKSQVCLSNADPEMIKLYLAFLTKACQIPEEKIRIALLAYPDLDETSLRRFWSFASGVPLSRFHKTVVIQGKHKTRRLASGVCTVVVSSTYFRQKMLTWLKLLPKELMNRGYYENISR